MQGRMRWYTLGILTTLTACLVGCGTTRLTDSPRTATEQLLISNAVDHAIDKLDFSVLAGKKVFFEEKYVDTKIDKGYLLSSLRQQILASGCLLQETRDEAEYIIEARAGGMGTDRHDLLVGVPEMSIPTIVPGAPSRIPELPFAKKTDQHGVAKVAVLAYNRKTGRRVWQSGIVKSRSSAKDLWVLGAGPFQHGSIRSKTTFAGEDIVVPFITEEETGAEVAPPPATVSRATFWEAETEGKLESGIDLQELSRLLPLGGTVPDDELFNKPNPSPEDCPQ